jgi:hypothetical protein
LELLPAEEVPVKTLTGRTSALVVLATLLLFLPLPAAGAGDSALAVRTRLLGQGWDGPGAVRLRWVDVTTFLASFGGHVVELDGWLIEGATSHYAPVGVDDLMGHVGRIAELTATQRMTTAVRGIQGTFHQRARRDER